MIALLENNPQSLQSNSAAVSRRFSNRNVPLNGQRTARIAKARPTIEELREYLHYEPETGVLRWKKARGTRAIAGQVAGSPARGTNRYKRVKFGGLSLSAHRVAFALHHGRWPHPCCDHINGNAEDNRAANLRECSHSCNMQNSRLRKDSSTGVKGVRKNAGGFLAAVTLNGKEYSKWFRHFEDAANCIKQLREQLHGEFARH